MGSAIPKFSFVSRKKTGVNTGGGSPRRSGRLLAARTCGPGVVAVRADWLTGDKSFLFDDILAALIVFFVLDMNTNAREIVFLLRWRWPRFSDALHRFLVALVHALAMFFHRFACFFLCLLARFFICHVTLLLFSSRSSFASRRQCRCGADPSSGQATYECRLYLAARASVPARQPHLACRPYRVAQAPYHQRPAWPDPIHRIA